MVRYEWHAWNVHIKCIQTRGLYDDALVHMHSDQSWSTWSEPPIWTSVDWDCSFAVSDVYWKAVQAYLHRDIHLSWQQLVLHGPGICRWLDFNPSFLIPWADSVTELDWCQLSASCWCVKDVASDNFQSEQNEFVWHAGFDWQFRYASCSAKQWGKTFRMLLR